jgi:hypothetical protein
MSYDLEFYFPIRPAALPTPRRGDESGITISGPHEIDSEDINDAYRHLVAGCPLRLTICCSGNRDNFNELERIKNEILASNDGVVVVDNQIGQALVGGKEISWANQAPRERDASISVYFEDGPNFENHLFDPFLDLIQRHIPSALPRRYGPVERLRFKLEKHGLHHFKAEWRKNPALAWQAHAPVNWVFTSIRNDSRQFPNGFAKRSAFARYYRCSLIEILTKQQLCDDANMLGSARAFLAEVAVLTGAFYSEIRMNSPQTSWWWHGIPPGSPLIAIVGSPYLELWPEFEGISRPLGSAHRLASSSVDATTDKITTPVRLADPRDKIRPRRGEDELYAPVFPFARPPRADRDGTL